MTGRELIIYIMANGLEDEPIFKNGKFVGHMTVDEAALMLGVGVSTACVLIHQGKIDAISVNNTFYIPVSSLVKYIEGSKNNER